MPNLTQPGLFRQVFDVYLDLGLSYHQAALVNYIHRWNDTGQECFAAIETIGTELRLPLRTMRRVIDRSISENIVSGNATGRGRARALKVTPEFLQRVKARLETVVAKVDTSSGQFVIPSGHFVTPSGQSGHLSRSRSRSISKSINDIKKLDLNNNKSKNDYILEWNEEKKAMIRRKAD